MRPLRGRGPDGATTGEEVEERRVGGEEDQGWAVIKEIDERRIGGQGEEEHRLTGLSETQQEGR